MKISIIDFSFNANSVITMLNKQVPLEPQNQNNIMNQNCQDNEMQQKQELTSNDILATLTWMTSSMKVSTKEWKS